MKVRISPWWARHDPEVPLAYDTCTRVGCRAATITPFDLYCSAPESHFLVLGDRRRLQVAVVYGSRGALGLLVLLAAALSTPIPLFAVAAIVGLALLVLPLRHFVTSQIVAPILWLGALAFAVATRQAWIGEPLRNAGVGGAIALVLLALLAAILIDDDGMDDAVTASLTVALAVALTAVLAGLALVAFGVSSLDGPVRTLLKLLLLGGLGSALGGAALTGVVRGARRVRYDPQLTPRNRLTARQLRTPVRAQASARTGNAAERMTAVLQPIAHRIASQLVDVVNLLLKGAYAFVDAVFSTVRRVGHELRRWSVRLILLIGAAARDAAVALADALLVLAGFVERWAAGTLLVVAAIVASAEASVVAAGWFASYLEGASLTEGFAGLLLALLAAALPVLVWWGLTRWPAREVLGAALRLLELALPTAFVVLVVLGWIDGLAGLAGSGPLHPGWLTFAGTAVVLLSVVWGYRGSVPSQP